MKGIHFKKTSLALVMMLSAISLTGCGKNLAEFATGGVGAQLNQRFLDNIAVVDALQSNGLMTKSEADALKGYIERQKEDYVVEKKGSDDGVEYYANITINDDGTLEGGDIIDSITALRPVSAEEANYQIRDDDGVVKILENAHGHLDYTNESENQLATGTTLETTYLSNYLLSKSGKQAAVFEESGDWYIRKSESKTAPIKAVPDSVVMTLNNKLNCKIYILKPDVSSGDGSMNELLNEVYGKRNNIDTMILSKYFEPARFTENIENCNCGGSHAVNDFICLKCLVDVDDILKVSEDNLDPDQNKLGMDLVIQQNDSVLDSELKHTIMSVKFQEFDIDAVNKLINTIGSLNDFGKWYLTSDGPDTEGVYAAYLMEYPVYAIAGFQDYKYDTNYVEAVMQKTDLGINIWSNDMLLYKYDNTNSAEYDKSPKYGAESSVVKSIKIKNLNTDYLTLVPKTNDADSSFYISGSADLKIEGDFKDGQGFSTITRTGRIILRDYLEGTYAPGMSEDSDLVVLGRKIRFDISKVVNEDSVKEVDAVRGFKTKNDSGVSLLDRIRNYKKEPEKENPAYPSNNLTEGVGVSERVDVSRPIDNVETTYIEPVIEEEIEETKEVIHHEDSDVPTETGGTPTKSNNKDTKILFRKGDVVANFVDADGVIIDGTSGLRLSDFCDYYALKDKDPAIVKLNERGMSGHNYESNSTTDKNAATDLCSGTTNNFIMTTFRFPGASIDIIDYAADTAMLGKSDEIENGEVHQIFYAMATCNNMFDTGLFSSWVNSPSSTASLSWWTDWLSTNNYKYSLNEGVVFKYIESNYKYELGKYGLIILDLNTIAKIQEEYDADAFDSRIKLIRTAYVLLGLILIGYAFILILAYVVDTNLDIGINLVEKMTFGNLVPVKYEADIPSYSMDGSRYIDFKGIMIASATMISVGIIISFTDVFEVVAFLIKTIGMIAVQFGKVLSGLQ